MISSDQALETGTQVGVTIVLAQFDLKDDQTDRIKVLSIVYCLILGTVPIAQICRLGISYMNTQTLR